MSTPEFRPDRRLFPFRSRFFDGRAGRIHYVDEGDGAPVVFLHGNPTWSFLYRALVVRLRDRFRCIAIDYPGFGLSDRPEDYGYTPAEHAEVVGELIRHLDLADATVVGHDWGGPIGLRAAVDSADRIRALVMSNTWYGPVDALHLKAFSALFSSAFGRGLVVRRNLLVERLMPLGMKREPEPAVLEHYRRALSDERSRVGAAELPRQLTCSRSWLRRLGKAVPAALGDRPLLLAWGMDDFAFTPSFMTPFRDRFETVRVVRLDARHYVPEDAPKEMAGAIRDFLEGPTTFP